MTVIDPLLEPRRARNIAIRALLHCALPLIALPGFLLLPFQAAAMVWFVVSLAVDRGGRPVEVWDALERPEKRERRRGISSAAFLRFWAERAGWPVERTLGVRRLLRVTTAVAYSVLGAWMVYGMVTRKS